MTDNLDNSKDLESNKIGTNINGTTKTKTEAPTSGITRTAEQQVKDARKHLKEAELDFVNLVHQHYSVYGILLTADKAKEDYALDPQQYAAFMSEDIVLTALGERAIPLTVPMDETSSEKWRNFALSGQQIIVADTMLDLLDNRSYRKKLQDLGVTTKQWTAWLKEPAFAQYLDENTQVVLKHGQHEAALALMDKVSSGDLNALKYYHEYTGRFTSKADKPAAVQQAEAIDAKRIVQSIIEIILEEVEDHDTAARIADRMRILITAVSVTNTLLQSNHLQEPVEITQPEVVENRVLTPAMKQTGMEI